MDWKTIGLITLLLGLSIAIAFLLVYYVLLVVDLRDTIRMYSPAYPDLLKSIYPIFHHVV
jgi:hypothetical protein